MRCRRLAQVICFISAFLFLQNVVLAATPNARSLLPGSVMPGRIEKDLEPIPESQALPAIKPTQAHTEAPLGKEAKRIQFKLTQIILEGNHVYSDKQLAAIYQKKLNTDITVEELERIAQAITNYYRNNGYILSRAILPPQHVKNGIVQIKILEGFIDVVRVQGNPKGAGPIVLAYGKRAAKSRPLKVSVLEHYLRLANELPGVEVRAVLEPSKEILGASDLNLVVKTKTFNAYASYDNYGTLYMGPNQMAGGVQAHSIFRSGDITALSYTTTSRPQELKYVDISHETPLGSRGLRFLVDANDARTQPGFLLGALKVSGDAVGFYTGLKYPVIRARDRNLTLDGGLNYTDSGVDLGDSVLYQDHIRSVKMGGSYDFADRLYGSNLIAFHVNQGFNIFGASNHPNSSTVSRTGGKAAFTKTILQMSRQQQIYGRFSAFVVTNWQYSREPLLSSEQFGFGGSQLGRGYDPSEIIGDRGASGSVELRMNLSPSWFILQAMQLYTFYDAGVIWNMQDLSTVDSKQSAASAGIGSRFVFTKNVSGNFMIAQPLTKVITTEDSLGRGRRPRALFSLVASI